MSEPTIKTDASPLSLSLSERLTLIDKLNNLPLSQFLELEGALNVPSGIMSAVQNPQGIRSNELQNLASIRLVSDQMFFVFVIAVEESLY
ncbi:MAG: hypothetical protein AAFQ57_15885 [Cyanobacteria bacterium J06626_14]